MMHIELRKLLQDFIVPELGGIKTDIKWMRELLHENAAALHSLMEQYGNVQGEIGALKEANKNLNLSIRTPSQPEGRQPEKGSH
jgi:hypothetical protein